MKKFFTFFAAMLLALTVNATSVTIGSNDPSAEHANALSAAIGYDTIYLKPGTYTEASSFSATYSKDLVLIATDFENKPVVKPIAIAIEKGHRLECKGIKFDATNVTDHLLYANDATAGNKLILEDCELYSFTVNGSLIHCGRDEKFDSCNVNNCYFRSIEKSCIFLENVNKYTKKVNDVDTEFDGGGSTIGLKITNSTFANISANTTNSYYAAPIQTKGETTTVVVDHCTFYNVMTMSTDYGAIAYQGDPSTDVAISNCIFALSADNAGIRAIYVKGGTVRNCLTHHYTKSDSHPGIHSGPTITGCQDNVDPKFKDVSKGYQLKGDYVNDDVSPARGAATDGTDLGDPRWYTPGTYPSTDFSGDGYVLAAANATLTNSDDNFKVVTPEAPDKPYIYYNNKEAFGTASWSITATRAALVEVILNLGTHGSHYHNFEIELYTERGALVDTIAEGRAFVDEYGDANTNKTLSGYLYVPAAGNYNIKLLNNRKWSKMAIYSVTLKYIDAPMPMYLKFGEGYAWDVAGAKFCAYSFEDGKTSRISDFMELAENETAIYKTYVPANYAKVIFIRNANTATKPGFDDKWNQTSNITREANKDFFIINGGSDQDYTGYWKKYNSALEDAYYLIGIVNGVEGWNEEDLTAARKFTADASAEVEDQMSVEAKLVSSDRIKAVYVEKKEIKYWYPNSGEGWIIDGNHTGDPQTVYLSPGGHGGTGWLNTVLFVPDNSATSIGETIVSEKAVKVIRNGQLFIEKDGKTYNVLGTVVK